MFENRQISIVVAFGNAAYCILRGFWKISVTRGFFWFLALQNIYSFYGNTNRRHLPVRTNPLSSLLFFHWPIHKSAMKWWSWPSWLNKWKAHFYCEKSITNKNFHHAVLLLAQNYLLIIEQATFHSFFQLFIRHADPLFTICSNTKTLS